MEIGAKMATQQEKTTKKDWPQNPFFFSKRAQDIELLKQVPESSHQTGSFSVSQHIGTLTFTQSAFLRIVIFIGDYKQFKSSLLQSTDHYGAASRQWELLLWKPQFTDQATSQLL